MPETRRREELEQERDAFDAALNDLLEHHRGDYVVFKNQKPVDFYSDFDAAYAAALSKFGPDGVFLVTEIKEPGLGSVSLAWDMGVLYAGA
jgi:hypothetical protein